MADRKEFKTLEELASYIGGSAWVKAGKQRVYFNGYGRDIKAYLDIDPDVDVYAVDEDGLVEGAALKVWSDAPQAQNWVVNRAKQVKHQIMLKVAKITGASVCTNWQEVAL